ncbi:integrase core domain-containing protein [Kitasatospora cineracea]|uniref:integrase core domain-containing protein n=1 Tax=Kitasatospora cineracea TaxID=88074 RepID=UPI0036D9136F
MTRAPACEGFHASLKREVLQDTHDFSDFATCRRAAFAWPTHYNTRCRHSSNRHLSPTEYERRPHTAELTLAARQPPPCPPSRAKARPLAPLAYALHLPTTTQHANTTAA